MVKQKIVLASILKPIDDTRMYEKMGSSLADSNQYDVFIMGHQSNKTPAPTKNIQFFGLKSFPRISWSRFYAPFHIFQKISRIKPHVLIVNTHELLIVAILTHFFWNTKIIYDIRENYYNNILYSKTFPIYIKVFIALYVRFKEKITACFFYHFILAEKSYCTEMNFFHHRYTILENKSLVSGTLSKQPINPDKINLIFTGTIAQSTGIFESIALTKMLHSIDCKVTLTIVGGSFLDTTTNNVQKEIAKTNYIQWTENTHLVSHQTILEEINKASFGIIYYPPSPHTKYSNPTKLYEYMAHQLPILTWGNQKFAKWVLHHKAGLIVSEPYTNLLSAMKKNTFYQFPIPNIYWEKEKFCELIKNTLLQDQ